MNLFTKVTCCLKMSSDFVKKLPYEQIEKKVEHRKKKSFRLNLKSAIEIIKKMKVSENPYFQNFFRFLRLKIVMPKYVKGPKYVS